MRILHIDTGGTMRGGQWQALYLLQELAGRGIHSQLLAPVDSPLFRAAESLRLPVLPLRLRSLVTASGRFDLVHAHDARAHTIGLLIRRPLVVSRRVAFPVKTAPASRLKYRLATHFIAVSEHVKQMLTDAGVESRKISIVYDGVRIPQRAAGEHQPKTGVLAIDSDDPRKGKEILEAAAKLADVPVHFSRHLPRDLPGAALFVYITDSEGLGSAVLLAMAHGTPVIASRTGGLPEIVEHGKTGLLTDNDPAKVAASIRRLLDDRGYASRLAVCARQQVERHFTVGHMADGTVLVYERILNA